MTEAQKAAVARGYRMDRRAQAARGAFYSPCIHDGSGEVFSALDEEVCRRLGTRSVGLDEVMREVDAMDEVTFARLTADVPEEWWD